MSLVEIPTPEMRFVRREGRLGVGRHAGKKKYMLQQKWHIVEMDGAVTVGERYEWRDVPAVIDND